MGFSREVVSYELFVPRTVNKHRSMVEWECCI